MPGAAPGLGRRALLCAAAAAAVATPRRLRAQPRRFAIGFANLTDDPGARLEGLGFGGDEVRTSFALAARGEPVDLVFYDNARDRAKALANAQDAAHRKLDLYIQYCDDAAANDAVAPLLASAHIPVLAVNHPVAGAPLYAADNGLAGRLAGQALAEFAATTWRGRLTAAAILGPVEDRSAAIRARLAGIREGLRQGLPGGAWTGADPALLDSGGNPVEAQAQLRRFFAKESGTKILVATLDDATALAAKLAAETVGRVADTVIVSQGCDSSVHGAASAKKVIDPANRNSIVLGSVAYFLDRYGDEILPLALRLLRGENIPPLTPTRHILVTAQNVFRVYPPIDMN
jgi:ribose transport system substrate-binding protein